MIWFRLSLPFRQCCSAVQYSFVNPMNVRQMYCYGPLAGSMVAIRQRNTALTS